MKYFNFKRYKFSTILKNISTIGYNFFKIFKLIDFSRYNFRKIYKYVNITQFKFANITKYFHPKTYSFNRIKKINFLNNKFLFLHLPLSIIFFALLYLIIPTFYNYDKSDIENIICKNKKIECLIKGEVNYRFYPTPRINIKDLIINDFIEEKKTLITVEDASVKLSIKNLLAKDKLKFIKIELNNFEINFNLKNLKKYRNIFATKDDFIPTFFKKGQIVFFDGKNYVATIFNTNIKLKFFQNNIETTLNGKFLNDNININLKKEKVDNKMLTNILFKMSNLKLLTKINYNKSEKDKNTISGNFLVKQGKNRITAIFDYKDDELIIKKSNVRNIYIDGRLEGVVSILPYFNFNLDLDLNSTNFTKLCNYFLTFDEKTQKNLFKINKKINGKLSLSSDKIYSSYNLAKSFESRIVFNNGNIVVEQFLLNMGKLGAADLVGTISNDKKFTNFKYESNIFVDNQKKLLSKFGIFNKENISSNLFISGNFDLDNLRNRFYEISDDEKINNDDINFIEKEFNDLMLEDGYKSLFIFPKFKEFIKSITSEMN